MTKRILVNILLIILVFTAVESYCFYKTKTQNEYFKQKADRLEANNTRQYTTEYRLLKPFNTTIYRKSFIKQNTDKKPIIWFGCSFAEGAGLEDNYTPCYKISELTGRSCINKAKGATGTQFMLYELQDNNFINSAPEAEYIIYTFIYNHIQRLYNYQVNPLIDMFNLRYKIKNGQLKNITPEFNPIYSSFFIKRLLNKKVFKQAEQESIDFILFNKILQESLNITKKNYPNSKFILLEFPDLSRKELPDYEVKKLERMGITVVKVTDLIKDTNIYEEKYWLSDNIHPTAEAWDLILPKLKEQYLN